MKTKNSVLAQLAVAFCFTLTCGQTAFSQRALAPVTKNLFTSVPVAEADSFAKVDSDILKRRLVRVNFREMAQNRQVGAKLPLNLFEDLNLDGVVNNVEARAEENYTLSGHLEGDEFSTFVLSAVGDAVAVDVHTAKGKLYQVRYVQDGLHEIVEVNQAKYPECGVNANHVVALPPVAADGPVQPQGDTGDIIDVMIVYTPAARTGAGSSNAMHTLINIAISGANTAFQDSLVNTRFRLVYAGEVVYDESAGFGVALSNLTTTAGGVMDEVHGLRNTYGADLVSLWIEDFSSCGVAWLMGPGNLNTNFAPSGFSVVARNCAVGNFSFAHELAHNMGCTHNREDAGGGSPLYPYSYGWRFTGNNLVNYRTIMAYNGSPTSTRIGRFSNPDVNYFGTPTGVPIGQPNESHNAQTINNSASTVANFRQSVISTNVPPSISIQPQPQSVAIGATATFSVTASGTPPLYYFWRKGGLLIAGATASSYSITNVQTSDTNLYSVIVSNAFGTVTSSNAALSISTVITVGAAVDNTGFTWGPGGGNAPWTGQTSVTHDNDDAAQSGAISHNSYSILQTTIVGPGTLSFWWKVSSEFDPDLQQGWDWLDVFLDGNFLDPNGISGEVDWTPRTFAIPPGAHTLAFSYFKDGSDFFPKGQDKGWVDQISYVADSSFATGSLGKTNGQFRVVFNGRAGADYTLQGSTNLTTWTTLTNVLSSSTNHIYLDPGITNRPMRFYRVTSP